MSELRPLPDPLSAAQTMLARLDRPAGTERVVRAPSLPAPEPGDPRQSQSAQRAKAATHDAEPERIRPGAEAPASVPQPPARSRFDAPPRPGSLVNVLV